MRPEMPDIHDIAAALNQLPGFVVPQRGLEPPRPDGHYTLNVARLPIPPLRHVGLSCNPIERREKIQFLLALTIHVAIREKSCQGIRAVRSAPLVANPQLIKRLQVSEHFFGQ